MTGKIPARNKFYIITNGEQTEYNYFTLLKGYKSPYDVKVEFQNADPLGLVQYAEKYVKVSNQVWCVFDIDYTHKDKRLVPAINQAEKHGIKYAFSNMSFEVWLISHFQKADKTMNNNEHKKILDQHLNEQSKGLVYNKTDKEMLKKYFVPKYRQAIDYSKVVYQNWMKEHLNQHGQSSRPCIWEWNSCSSVFKLVEALRLQQK